MIKVKYECDETGQEMEVLMTLPESKDDMCEVRINFTPEINDESTDPAGVMGRIFSAFKLGD